MGTLLRFLALLILCSYISADYNEEVSHDINCPTDWRYFDSKCYHYAPSYTFEAARQYCQDLGADIVVYDYRMELEMTEQWYGNADFWVGLRILDGETIHTWFDGKKASETYTRWSSTEPDGGTASSVAYLHNYYLHDSGNSTSKHTLCEKRADKAGAKALCGSHKHIRENSRPVTHSLDGMESRSLPQCSQTCLLQGHRFAALVDDYCVCAKSKAPNWSCNGLSEEKKIYYEETTVTKPETFGITISQPDNADCFDASHTYYNGHCYIYVGTDMEFFEHLKAAKELYGDDATIVSFSNEAEARFVDEVLLSSENRVGDSVGRSFYVGVYDDRNVCDDGWTAFDGACFYYPDDGLKASHANRTQFCQDLRAGADLVWFENSNDMTHAMEHIMPDDHTSRTIEIWSNLYDINGGGDWKYPAWNNQPGHFEWESGTPVDSPIGRCTKMTSNLGYRMHNTSCTNEYEALCRYNVRERGSAQFVDFVNMEHESLSDTYSRWLPGHGYDQVPYCAYYDASDKFWHHTDCKVDRAAIYEYPAMPSFYESRGGLAALLPGDDIVDAFTTIEAKLTHDTGPLSENSVSFTDGDGQFDWDKPFTSFSHVATQLGQQEVNFDSTDFWYQRNNGSTTYQVVLPVEGASVQCPLLVDTTYEMECEIAATGDSPSGMIDFGDGLGNATRELPGSSLMVVGPDIRRQSSSNGQATDGNSVVMFNSRFTAYGFIQAFEFDAIQAGQFHFVIWRPSCAAEEVFCYKSMACHPIEYKFDVCETVTNWHKRTCDTANGHMWSLSMRACVDADGNEVGDTVRYHSNMPYTQMTNVGEFTTTTARRGRHFIRLKREEMINVEPGDVLGFIGIDGKLADFDVGEIYSSYAPSGTKQSFPESTASTLNYEFFLNAHLATYTHLLVAHSYKDVGIKNVTLETTNSIAIEDGSDVVELEVYERVMYMEIIDIGDFGRNIIRGEDEDFEVNVHEGDPVTYEWDFADGTPIITETTGKVTHAFAVQGRYNVTVRGYNELSEDIAWTFVLVQAPIRLGTPTQFDNSTKLGVRSVFKYCVDDGNELTYSLTVEQMVYGLPHPGYSVFELDSAKCQFGFVDGEPLKCYQPTPSADTFVYDDTNACNQLYNRSYPVYYSSQAEYTTARSAANGDGMFTGFHRGASGGWYDWYGREITNYPTFGTWDHQSDEENCTTISDSRSSTRDCSSPAKMMCMYEGRCETFTIELPQIGVYKIKLKAENLVTSVNDSFIQYVERPITGLTIHPIPSQRWGDVVVLNVTWDSGSRLHATCYNNLTEGGEECWSFVWEEDIDGGPSRGLITVNISEYKIINDHHRFIKFWNMISSMTTTQTFRVMYEIQGMALANDHHPCAITKEDLVTYTLTFDQMSHGTVSWTFADQTVDTSDETNFIAEITNGNPIYPTETSKMFHYDITHKYPVEGTYTITVNITNDISFATVSRSIVIENPIRGYRYEKTSPVPLWPGQIARVNITLIFDKDLDNHINEDKGLNLIPTDVRQSYKYGTPDCSLIGDVNECDTGNGGCDHVCVNTLGSFYCLCNFNYYLHYDGKSCHYGNGTNMTTAAPTPPPIQTGKLTTPDMWKYLGKTCPEGTHTDMVYVTETVTDIDYFDYTHYGTFDVELYFQNCISDQTFTFTVDIDQPVMNLSIVSDEYILPWSANSTLTVTMDWGSRIEFTYNFDDTNPDYEVTYDRLYPNFVEHHWNVEGTFYPWIKAVNLIDTYTAVTGPVYIQYILADALRVETDYIWVIPYPGYEKVVYFKVYLKSEYTTMMPTNVTANVTFGDWDELTNDIAVLNEQYLPNEAQFNTSLDYASGDRHVWTFPHNYKVGDTYNVTIDFINWVSTLSIDVEFHAIEEVSDLYLFPMILDEDIFELSDDAVDWSYPLHHFVDCEKVLEMATKTTSCMFGLREVLGVYVDISSPYNPTNLASDYKHIPTDETRRPRIGESNFLAYLDGSSHLSQEELKILVDDSIRIRSLLNSSIVPLFDEFLVMMEKNPPLTVANTSLLSRTSVSLLDDVLINDWMVRQQWAYDKESLKESVYEAHIQPGDSMYSYPVEKAVTTYVEFERGTHYHVYWDWGDGFTEITLLPFANHRYDIPGVYVLEVTVFNANHSRTIVRSLNLQRTITNLTFEGPDIVTRNHTNRWTFNLGSIGTDACYIINFKDRGTDEFPIGNRYFFIGDKATCNVFYKYERGVQPEQVQWLDNQANERELALHGAVLVHNTFTFGSLGTYRVTFTGVNRVSSETFLMPIAVTKGPCFRPLVLLNSENPCEPLCKDGQKIIYRSVDIKLYTAVAYNCTTTDLAYHDWHIYSVYDNGTEIELDINQTLYSSYNDTPIRKLEIPSLTLDYGKYKVTLNITMFDEDVWKEDIMYFHIMRSPLKAGINGEFSKIYDKWQYERNYTLDASSFTYDPDNPTDREGFVYKWQCRRYCEQLPVYDDDGNEVVPAYSYCKEVNSSYYIDPVTQIEESGCFIGDGYGIGNFTSSTEGSLLIDLSMAYELDLIQFVLEITKGPLKANLAMYLEVTMSMPPQINPNLCVSNCKDKVNAEAIFSLKANIVRPRKGATYYFLWTLFRGISSDFNDPSTEEIPPAEWNKNLPLDGSKESMVQTGNTQQSFAFEPGFFSEDDTSYYFFLAVFVWREGRIENSGLALTRFQVNESPERGNCTVFPLNGTAAQTLFNTECVGFYDQHKPVMFQFGSRVVGKTNIMWGPIRPHATDAAGGTLLSEGNPVHDYEVELYVRAQDSIGGKTVSNRMIVKVLPGKMDMNALTVTVLASGDPLLACSKARAYADAINREKLEREVEEQARADAAQEEERVAGEEAGEVEGEEKPVELTEEELAEIERQKQEAAAKWEKRTNKLISFREKLALALARLPVKSLEHISAVNQAGVSVAIESDHLTEEAITALVSLGVKSVSALTALSKTMDAELMNEKCTEVIDLGNLLTAAIAELKSKLAPTTDEVPLEEGADGEAQAAEEAEVEESREEESVESTLDVLFIMVAESNAGCSKLVSSLKVPGEGDTVMKMDTSSVALLKKFAADFNRGQMANSGSGSGVALPNGKQFIGEGNDTIPSAETVVTSNNDKLPQLPAGSSNDTSNLPSGQTVTIVIAGPDGAPLNMSANQTIDSHIFMKRENGPKPTKIVEAAAKYGEKPVVRKVVMPAKSALQAHVKKYVPEPNVTLSSNATDNATTTQAPAPAAGRRKRSIINLEDPFLPVTNETKNYTIFDDFILVYDIKMRMGSRPTDTEYDFSCMLPIRYYSIDENTTVAIGGTIRHTVNCEELLAENPNNTCESHTLNREVYPLNKEITEADVNTCYISDTWLNSYDADLELYMGVNYYYINSSDLSSLENVTYEQFAQGYIPQFTHVAIPEELEEPVTYEMAVSASNCKYWSPFYEDYISDGCEVGPLTSETATHCVCGTMSPAVPPYDENDATMTPKEYERKVKLASSTPGMTFGGGISIPINTIDLNNSAFNNLGENPLVFSLMVSIMCLYLCSLIWAHAQDRKDAIKAGVSPLLDNDPRDKYLYEVTVYTGTRTGSSTTAKVSIIFSGEEDETNPRLMFDDKRPVLQSGGVDSFVMATPRSLGSLSHIRVWHDNSGKSPGWFFSRMQVVDMQTLEKYFFILDRWLSAGEDDGIIDRIVPLAGKDELTGFSHLFFTKARKDLMDGHIWFSIFGKPHKSNFTRCQRLTCCLALLFASMTANIFLFKDPTDEANSGTPIRLGPIEMTLEQILTGIISSLIAFPINVLIALIFKNTKEPPYDLKKRCCSCCKKSRKRKSDNNFAADELAHQAKILDGGRPESRAISFASLGMEDEDDQAVTDYLNEEAKKRNSKFKLPWGFLFVAYFLALCVTGVSFWYTVEVAGTFGPKKSAVWVGSFCTSIIESIFLSQPIKVLGIALFWALVIKKPAADDDVDPGLEKGEEYLHKHEKQCQKLDQKVRKRLSKYKNVPLPPTEEYLAAARALRQKELKMMDILKEIFLYVIFLNLLMMVSYGNRDPAGSSLYNTLYGEFHDAVYYPNSGLAFTKVTEYNTFWDYCNSTLLPSLWPDAWYDGKKRDPGFTVDRNMYRVGVPRLRQLRMHSEQCEMPMYRYTKECNLGYNIFTEDTGVYYPGWYPVANESEPEYKGPYPGWFWQSSADLEGFPFQGREATYGGGGFNIELGHTLDGAQKTLNTLRELEWLTPETRAVVVEFVLYNANMNLFAVSSMTFEFLNTGSVVPVYKMNLIKLDRYIGTYMITVMVSEILTFLFIFYFLYREIKVFKAAKRKYFKSFWNIVEFITLSLCLAALVMFFARFAFIKKTAKNFRENSNNFTSFQFATTWEEIYGYILAFIIFLANVKFLKLLRFNKKMSMLGMTMMYIGKPLLSFLLALGIVFLAFAQMAYLVYCRLLLSFSTFVSASTTLFTLMLNKFDYKALEDANAIFAPIIFFSFTILVSFVLLSFMVTIILEGFMEVTEELKRKENEYEIVDFIVTKFKGAVGLGKGPELPPMNREPQGMIHENHSELMDRFEDFEEMFREFCSDETRGEEPLVAKYEREILMARRNAKNKTIYST